MSQNPALENCPKMSPIKKGRTMRCSRDPRSRGDHGATGSGNTTFDHYAGQTEEYEQGNG